MEDLQTYISTTRHLASKLIVTRCQGTLSENEIAIWETSLKTVLSEIEDNDFILSR